MENMVQTVSSHAAMDAREHLAASRMEAAPAGTTGLDIDVNNVRMGSMGQIVRIDAVKDVVLQHVGKHLGSVTVHLDGTG